MTLDDLPLMLTVEEAARLLRIGRNGAYSAIAQGDIPSIRIGRIIRIPRQALAGLLGVPTDGLRPGVETDLESPGYSRAQLRGERQATP